MAIINVERMGGNPVDMKKKPAKKRKAVTVRVRHVEPLTEAELKAWADRYVRLAKELLPQQK